MTIKNRLVSSVALLSLIVFTLASLATVLALRQRLIHSIDEEIYAKVPTAVEGIRQAGVPIRVLMAGFRDQGPFERFLGDRDVAIIVVLPNETLAIPAGNSDGPRSLPNINPGTITEPRAPFTVSSLDGSLQYRAAVHEIPGGLLVMAASLDDTQQAVRSLSIVLLGVSIFAVAVVATGTSFIVRRGFRPVDNMITTAEQVGEGTLSQRLPVADPETEVGHLATALNNMLGRVEDAVAVREESEARLRRFASDASHELRTPLTSILGYAELYRQGGDGAADVERSFGRIESEGGRMARMLEQLLQLARLDQSTGSTKAATNILPLVEGAVEDARVVEPQRQVSLVLPDSPVMVEANEDQISQIVANLLSNVRDHTGPTDEVTVSVVVVDTSVEISVSDAGPGMSQDAAAKAFDRFFRSNPTGSGSGLGLSIVDAIARDHKGSATISVSSGTKVSVVLPLTQ